MKYLLLILLTSCCNTKPFIQVIDGDSVRIIKNGKVINVRLAHIDAPELKQNYGLHAKEYLQQRLINSNFTITYTGKGIYGRPLGIIYIGEENINLSLVKNGLAWHYKKYSKLMIYSNYQDIARKNRKGLWCEGITLEPWNYRKQLKDNKK